MRIFAAFVFLVMSAAHAAGQDTTVAHSKILATVSDRKYEEAVSLLTRVEKDEPNIFRYNNYDYLLARMLEKTGDFAGAMRVYQGVANRGSILKPYALFHLSRIVRATGNLMLERLYLQELASFEPNSLLAKGARKRLVRSSYESKDFPAVIAALNNKSNTALAGSDQPHRNTASDHDREDRLLLAKAYLAGGNQQAARENFAKLVSDLANPAQPDDIALEAVKALDRIDSAPENAGKSAPLTDYEHLRRAQIYQFNRDFADARTHFLAIAENHPSSGIVPDAVYQIGRGYAQQASFAEAVGWFERTLEQFPEHPVAKDALLQAASAYSRVAKFNEAISRYKKFIEKYGDDERIDRAYLNIIDILRDQGEEAEALKWSAKVQEIFKDKLPAALALFADARVHLAKGDWQSVYNTLDKLRFLPNLGGTRVPGGTNAVEVAFLRAFALEQMSRYREAIDAYLSISDGRAEYYGWRATVRLQALATMEAAKPSAKEKLKDLSERSRSTDPETSRKSIQAALRLTINSEKRDEQLASLKKVYASLPPYKKIPSFEMPELGRHGVRTDKPNPSNANSHKQIADELLFLGLYDEAAPELAASASNTNATPSQTPTGSDFALAIFFARGDLANHTVAFAEPLWKNVPADYQIELIPREQIELLYPVPFEDELLKYAPLRGVDPRFLLSIMRQESRFRTDVKSYAAARGLMQFISATAEKIAGEVGRPNFRQDDLYDPATSILFGSQYTANLFRMFPNQPQAVAASYNGGEDNMRRWMNRSHSDLADRYVAEIAFSQSKDYVYKVTANYRVYQMFYDENLKSK